LVGQPAVIGSDTWWGMVAGVAIVVVPLIVIYVVNVYRLARWRARYREVAEWNEYDYE
jgi:membrane protein YdbS with pleckstrin-like domain